MNSITSRFVLLSLFLLICPKGGIAADSAPAAKPAKTVRLLTVGNSFSQNATRFLGSLASSSGNVLIHHQAVIGGATLAQHWEKAEQYEVLFGESAVGNAFVPPGLPPTEVRFLQETAQQAVLDARAKQAMPR